MGFDGHRGLSCKHYASCRTDHEDVHGTPVEQIRVTPVERARRAEEALRELAEGKHEASPATRAFARSFSRSEPSEPRA